MQTYTLLPLFWRALRCALLLVLLFLILPLALSARTPDRRAPSGEGEPRAAFQVTDDTEVVPPRAARDSGRVHLRVDWIQF
jgi:hypothetical protein